MFVTAGACGPCRFGTYVTEYRKALRDSGFEGFRVLLFQQQGGLKQATGEEQGLKMNPKFFIALLKAILIGDVLNMLGYRIRPYEVVPGSTDRGARGVEAADPRRVRRPEGQVAAVGADPDAPQPDERQGRPHHRRSRRCRSSASSGR